MNKSQARKETVLSISSKSNLAKKLAPAVAEDPGMSKVFGDVTLAEVFAFKPGPRVKPAPKAPSKVPTTKRGRGRPVGSGKAPPPPSDAQVLAAVKAVSKLPDACVDIETKARWVRATQIAWHLGVTTAATRKGLGRLVKGGSLRSSGKAAGTRYALAS